MRSTFNKAISLGILNIFMHLNNLFRLGGRDVSKGSVTVGIFKLIIESNGKMATKSKMQEPLI
jgi:hypothetical protein